MSRKTKEEAEKTRARILASALSLFVRKGYDCTTFNDIAARLKMTKGAVYWHFKSKEKLLLALIEAMLAKFRRQLEDLLPPGGGMEALSFPDIAKILVMNAKRIVSDPSGKAYFLLVHENIRWADESMGRVREDLLTGGRPGPWTAVRRAVENDIAAGRVRADADPVKVASVCVSIWDGLVHGRIAGVLQCDLVDTLKAAYEAVWNSLKTAG